MKFWLLTTATFLITCLLSSCSTLLASVGTEEESLINARSTSQTLKEKFGAPFQIDTLSEPMSVDDLRKIIPRLDILSDAQSNKTSGSDQSPQVTTWSRYVFTGRLQKKHDVGETLSINLMTLGILEPFLTVGALKDRAVQRSHLLTVWFNAEGKALAYVWSKPRCEDFPHDAALCPQQKEASAEPKSAD